jgi:hypothetical protein
MNASESRTRDVLVCLVAVLLSGLFAYVTACVRLTCARTDDVSCDAQRTLFGFAVFPRQRVDKVRGATMDWVSTSTNEGYIRNARLFLLTDQAPALIITRSDVPTSLKDTVQAFVANPSARTVVAAMPGYKLAHPFMGTLFVATLWAFARSVFLLLFRSRMVPDPPAP